MGDETRRRSNPVGRDVLPQEGTVQFENGELIFRDRQGTETGRLFNSKTGPMLDGVFSVVQREDPAEFRIGSYYADGLQGGGKISFNRIRSDGMQEELGYLTISHEDNPIGDNAGQLKIYLRTNRHDDPWECILVSSTAYSDELFGHRTVYVGLKNPMATLGKFEAPGSTPDVPQPGVPLPPSPPQPPPPPPPPVAGYVYKGFAQGDFVTLRAAGPVEDTDPPDYARNPTEARWRDFVDKMLRRRG